MRTCSGFPPVFLVVLTVSAAVFRPSDGMPLFCTDTCVRAYDNCANNFNKISANRAESIERDVGLRSCRSAKETCLSGCFLNYTDYYGDEK